MDLSTTYLGFDLPHPLMPGASPLTSRMDQVKRLEDAGAAAIVMHSIFEEQIVAEQLTAVELIDTPAESFAEAISYFPNREQYRLGADEYLEQIRRIKDAVSVPVIGSLNGMTLGGWLDYAKRMEQAGADALELNFYYLPTDSDESADVIEKNTLAIVDKVKKSVNIPVAAKLSPFYSALPHFADQLDNIGIDGLVIFNRFYQPDIDVETLEVKRSLELSDSSELLRLRWLAILSGSVKASLALTGGAQTALDAVKAVMAGAHAVQMVSALLKNGPEHLGTVREGLSIWLEQHEYDSLKQMQGSMDLKKCPEPKAYERANYIHILQAWDG